MQQIPMPMQPLEKPQVAAGEHKPILDMGIYPLGSWSGNVSKDNDHDDIGDENLSGVTIELFADTNGDGQPDGAAIATTTTDASGNYSFTNLTPGDYVAVETQPAGLDNVSENEGGVDNDDNGNAADNNQISGHVDAGENDANNDFVEIENSTPYHIGTHFWIDGSNGGSNDGVYQEGTEEPIGNALVELLDENGTKLYWADAAHSALGTAPTQWSAETNTTATGEYGFDVPAGSYRVRFTIPQNLIDEGYDFVQQSTNADNNINENVADNQGITQIVTVGPGHKTADLTLDAAVNCACSGITSDGGDALTMASLLVMMFLTLSVGLLFVRREEQQA